MEHENTMKEIASNYEENKFRNWYLGITKLAKPYDLFDSNNYDFNTWSTYGSISTPYYGKEINIDNFQQKTLHEYRFKDLFENINPKKLIFEMNIDLKETKGRN